ncbi:uncharacterized protein LOC110978804 [Acanthaster planci]|uniref:Uncharacterized protein LOC110978804 n=1 Tax=Acanthaster planci TaxID=133434 RepID=A0A8B7Y965_ACAPL|nr:uncharacterized protein LOC110978804 [Acanthaster planci]
MTSCTSDPGQCPGGQSTWSIWMKLNHADNPGPVTFLSSGTGSNTGVSFSRLLDGNFEVAVNIRSAQWLRSLDDNLIPDGVWFHLVIVIDTTASTQLDVYIDGTQQGVFSSTDGISTTATPTLATPFLTLGGTSGSDGQRDATSAFSDFMIFETKLTTTKIKNLHECGVVVNPRETQIKEVWNILQLEVSNPNELGYRCVLQSMERPGGGDVAWHLYLHGNNKIPLGDRTMSNYGACFYKSDLLINKYNDLVQRGCTSNCQIMCEFKSSAQLYQTRNIAEADLIYEWTPWLSSSSPQDNPVGDNETITHLLQVYPVDGCAYPVRIECRERYTMKTPEYLRDREVDGMVDNGSGLEETRREFKP